LKEYLSDFTFDEYLKADVLVSSRIIKLSRKCEKDSMVLAPIFDMMNHANPNNSSWRYNEEKQGIELFSNTEISAGSEINISYGSEIDIG